MRLIVAFVSALLLCANALAQSFPNRPVRIVVPFPAGGGADVVTRIVAPKISEIVGQPVVVDNRAGAGGIIGADYVAKSPGDGYTLLVATASLTINQTLAKTRPWDIDRDFVPVAMMIKNQNVLVVHPSVQANSVRELIALAKASPGKVTYASFGSGSSAHLITELFKMMTGTDMLHVPYKGAAPAVNDVLGGQVNLIFTDIAAILPHIRAGKVRALGVSSTSRFSGLPDVAPIADSGVPGFEGGGFLALVAPTGTPGDAIKVLNDATNKVLAMPDIRKRIDDLAGIPLPATPADLGKFMAEDVAKWARVIKAGNIQSN
jgi:tripartite-type tricarboxylate transporter receptor subunit TctC